ncbi:MAG TPA: hypothetical protein VFJ95_17385 [Gammaproteobacteria bacterium]|nr:hypothetical protein [Gammaproteobacteria bacterium]
MNKPKRYRINAVICLLPLAHSIYWFASGKTQGVSAPWIGFFVAEGVIGLLAALWFLSRSRRFMA